jgi:hypothetical protein
MSCGSSPTSVDANFGARVGRGILRIAPRLVSQKLAGREQVWGAYHFTAEGVTTWHGFASRIVAVQAPIIGRNPRVTPITTADYPLAALCRYRERFGFVCQYLWPRPRPKSVIAVT